MFPGSKDFLKLMQGVPLQKRLNTTNLERAHY